MNNDAIVTLLVAVSAFGAVALRTFWDLKSKSEMSPKRLFWLRMLLVVFSGVILFGAWLTFRRTNTATVESRQQLQRVLEEVRTEFSRVGPHDFQIRVAASNRGSRLSSPRAPAPPVHITASLGSATVSFELADLGAGATDDVRGGRGAMPGSMVRYAAHNMTAYGLEAFPYLESLNGQALEFTLPFGRLQPSDAAWQYFVDVSIRGRLFSARPDKDGRVRIEFSGL
jgi:hypothetical protein